MVHDMLGLWDSLTVTFDKSLDKVKDVVIMELVKLTSRVKGTNLEPESYVIPADKDTRFPWCTSLC
jgi:hypothetical protein